MSESLRLLRGNEQMSNSLKKCWLKKSKILFYYVLFKIFFFKFQKNERIAHFRSFPLFWSAMWVNRSFPSNQMSNVSELLISVTKNEWPWVICSGWSEEMSDVSESLILLTKNEQMRESLIFLSESLICSFLDKKQAICLEIKWANSQPCIKITAQLEKY